ncbi:MAG: hypothetical protein H0T62_01965 [Parachlamydiaceae bacterium]|nr:hypothetical protein [Parachlamydiaceae bacterium]
MSISLSLFGDFILNGISFAEDAYNQENVNWKDVPHEKMNKMKNVWGDIRNHSQIASAGNAVLPAMTIFASSAGLINPIGGIAITVSFIALSGLTFYRMSQARCQYYEWDRMIWIKSTIEGSIPQDNSEFRNEFMLS